MGGSSWREGKFFSVHFETVVVIRHGELQASSGEVRRERAGTSARVPLYQIK